MPNKKILIFSLAYFPVEGGAEIAVKEITNRLSGIEFDMVTMQFSREHPKFERVGNVNVYRIGGGLGYLSKILFIPQAAFFALKRRYDAFWCLMTYMLFPVVMARIFGDRTPFLLTLQDGDPWTRVFNRFHIFPFLPLLFYGFRHANKIQAISNFLADWAIRMGHKDKIEVIPNGVDVRRFESVKSRAFDKNKVVLITTSRLVKKNGVGDIIEALKYLPENVHLKILGTGPLEIDCKLKIENWKLGGRVEMLGHVDYNEIPRYLHQSDIFIRPSLSEGFGNSFIEAMATGLPVIATNVGGIPDFLKDYETGLFCEANNPESIAEKVMEYMHSPELTSKVIKNARAMVENKYDWNLVAKQMKAIFDKLDV